MALLLGLTAALVAQWGLDRHPAWPADFSGYAACIENGNDFGHLRGHTGVGTHGGAMDHTAICGAAADSLTCWSMAPVFRRCDVQLPRGVTLMVAVSGVLAEKTGSAQAAYNAVSQRAFKALRVWNEARQRQDATLSAAVAAGAVPADFADPDLALRVEQFIQESNVIVPLATSALRTGDLTSFAQLVQASQSMATSHLRNQISETTALVAIALRHGAYAASGFGAGFGGSVWAVVASEQVESFGRRWLDDYGTAFPHPGARVYPIRIGSRMERREHVTR